MAYQVVSSAGSYTASKTIPTARYWGATIASFRASSTGAISYMGDIGTTANRPTINTSPGQFFYDATLGKPIWRNAANTGWTDATGAAV